MNICSTDIRMTEAECLAAGKKFKPVQKGCLDWDQKTALRTMHKECRNAKSWWNNKTS